MESTTTRRALLGALVTLPAIAAVPALAEVHQLQPIADDYGEGHDDGRDVAYEAFAVAWLKQFTDIGCYVYLDRVNDRISCCFPCFSLSVAGAEHERLRQQVREQDWFKALSPKDQRRNENDARSFTQTFWEGKTRGLWHLIDAFPEGFGAVERIIRLVPQLGMPRKLGA